MDFEQLFPRLTASRDSIEKKRTCRKIWHARKTIPVAVESTKLGLFFVWRVTILSFADHITIFNYFGFL